jgi:iron(III) transport system permease protein
VAVTQRGAATAQPLMLSAAALLVVLVALVPVGFVAVRSLAIGAEQAQALVLRPRVGGLLLGTVQLTLAATLLCALLGVGVAWVTERTDVPGRQLWAVLAALPLTVPAFVSSYSWVSLSPALHGFWGALLVVTLAYYPLVYLPVAAVMRRLDPALEEVARSQGRGPWQTFLRVTLPQVRFALLGGCLLVALDLLSEFGTFELLRFNTLTTAIYDAYQLSFDGPAASTLAVILGLLCVLLLTAEGRLRGPAFAGRVGAGAARRPPVARLGRATPLVLLACAALVAVALGVPLGMLLFWLLHGSSAAFQPRALAEAALATLGLGLGAAALTTVCALPVAVLAVRYGGRFAALVERGAYLSRALPGIIVALALVVTAVHLLRPLYQSTALLLVGYAVLFLPLALVSVRAAITQSSPGVEEVARSLGCRPLATLLRVTLPIVAPGIGAAAALVFLSTATELTATLLLAPTGTQTLATQVWAETDTLSYAAAAPYAALLIGLSALPTYVLIRRLGPLGPSARAPDRAETGIPGEPAGSPGVPVPLGAPGAR